MATTMKDERRRWVQPIASGTIRLVDAAKVCPYSKRSLERWVAAYKKGGETTSPRCMTEHKTPCARMLARMDVPEETKKRFLANPCGTGPGKLDVACFNDLVKTSSGGGLDRKSLS